MRYSKFCHLFVVLSMCGSPFLLTGASQGLSSTVPDAGALHRRLGAIGRSYASGGATAWDASNYEMPSRILTVALRGLDFEAIPLEATVPLEEYYLLVERVVPVVTPDDGEVWRITGQIASPENGCLVWRRAALAAIHFQGTWRIGGPVVEVPLSHAASAPCIKGGASGGATQLRVAAEPAQQ